MVNQPKRHHKKAMILNKNLVVVVCHIMWNQGERINVWDVVGLVWKKIALILIKPLPSIFTPINLILITRFMVMMLTIISHYILSFNKTNHKQEMQGDLKGVARAKKRRHGQQGVIH